MLCKVIAPGAVGLSALLQSLQGTCQRAWMATETVALQDASQAAAAASTPTGQAVPTAAELEQQQQQQQRPQQLSSLQQQYLYQMPQTKQQAPQLPKFVPQAAEQQPLPILQALQLVQVPETVEAHVRLKVDPRRGDQMVRGAAVLPHSLGKPLRIAVFAEGAEADEARQAGADIVGSDELVAAVLESKGKGLDFNAVLATPDMMPRLVKLGRILGPKGLMPNPKMGTLTTQIAAAIADLRRGRVEFKMDRTGIVHAPLGRVTFDLKQLQANIGALTAALLAAKPEAIKGGLPKYVKSVHVCSSMGAAVPVEVSSLLAAMEAAAAVLARQASKQAAGEQA
ncbi:ribosomal protein L1-like protein [Scenedesmus sp. NREL 46B-D3]|nr:ribosomal protein L1-like protein [Scenedesmus sp. NREL 46B-D3]